MCAISLGWLVICVALPCAVSTEVSLERVSSVLRSKLSQMSSRRFTPGVHLAPSPAVANSVVTPYICWHAGSRSVHEFEVSASLRAPAEVALLVGSPDGHSNSAATLTSARVQAASAPSLRRSPIRRGLRGLDAPVLTHQM